MDAADRETLLRRIDELQLSLREAEAHQQQLEIELADAVIRINEAEQDLRSERELCRALQEAAEDESLVETLERIIVRHSVAMRDERSRLDAAVQHERALLEERLETAVQRERARLEERLEAATIRHEQAILALVASHRHEVSQRLDRVLAQNREIFTRVTSSIQDVWSAQGTTRPSLDKEHWFLLAREDDGAPDGTRTVSFKIHAGQKDYIDRIGRTKDVVASPAASGVDIRQSAKKRMRDLTRGQNDIDIKALRFACADPDRLDWFLALLFESIDIAVSTPRSLSINRFQEEASQNIREAFMLETLFVGAAVGA